jgi:hypothetical protein
MNEPSKRNKQSLVQRLRAAHTLIAQPVGDSGIADTILLEAADEIQFLQARVKELQGQLHRHPIRQLDPSE